MDILGENGAFQNIGLCIDKKCKDTDQIDDFLQLCIQMIFYEKISLSGLVPDYIKQRSSEIIDVLKREYKFFNIDFQDININDSDELIKEVSEKYYFTIDNKLEEYKTIIKNAKGLLPKLNDETFEKLKKSTEAIKNNNINALTKGDLSEQSTFSTDSSVVKIICYKEEIFKKLVEFSKEYDWNETMALQLISDLRVITNKILATKNRKIYSPAVRRGRKEKKTLEKIFILSVEKLTRNVSAELCSPSYIEMPSIKEYLVEKGAGNPIKILKISSELREKFKPVREYIINMGKSSIYNSLQTLNEISTKVIEEAKTGKPSEHRKIIENIIDLNLGPLGAIPLPDTIEIDRESKLNHCVLAFTETIEDMILHNEKYYYKELIKNCMEA